MYNLLYLVVLGRTSHLSLESLIINVIFIQIASQVQDILQKTNYNK